MPREAATQAKEKLQASHQTPTDLNPEGVADITVAGSRDAHCARLLAGSRHSLLYGAAPHFLQEHSCDGWLAVHRRDANPTSADSAPCALKRSGMDENRGGVSQFRTCVLISDVHRPNRLRLAPREPGDS
jgi:hypothetical protein